MNINDYDKTIDNSRFITKVDNVFTLLCMSIMQGNMDRSKHKMTEELRERYQSLIDQNNSSNVRQMFDELNISETTITNIDETEEGIRVNVKLLTKYMDYKVNKDNFNLVSGDNTKRIEKTYNLTFFKKASAKQMSEARRCPGCGSTVDISKTGKCEYCGSTFNTEDYDYVLVDITY